LPSAAIIKREDLRALPQLEWWNDGFKETSIQNPYYFIDFFVLREYFSGKKQILGEHHQTK
jgi:hypothetical protein